MEGGWIVDSPLPQEVVKLPRPFCVNEALGMGSESGLMSIT